MWIFTVDGFYSAVQDRNDPTRIIVRARQRADLEALLKRLEREEIEILAWSGSDYAYRVFIPREMWISYLETVGKELDYPNFKARALSAGDYERSNAYHRVWGVLREWQDKEK
jgi:hypothetical protein